MSGVYGIGGGYSLPIVFREGFDPMTEEEKKYNGRALVVSVVSNPPLRLRYALLTAVFHREPDRRGFVGLRYETVPSRQVISYEKVPLRELLTLGESPITLILGDQEKVIALEGSLTTLGEGFQNRNWYSPYDESEIAGTE